MKKRFNMNDLDCANCAAKMEEKIKKIAGVDGVTISFMAQKLTIEAEEALFGEIMPMVEKAIKSIDSECGLEY